MILFVIMRSSLLVLTYHSFGQRNHHGSGVAFVVSDQLHICVTPYLLIREGTVESLWIELFPQRKNPYCCNVMLHCAYHPPSKADFYDLFTLKCEKSMVHNAQNFQV